MVLRKFYNFLHHGDFLDGHSLSHLQRFPSETADSHHAGEGCLLFRLVAESDEAKTLAAPAVVHHN